MNDVTELSDITEVSEKIETSSGGQGESVLSALERHSDADTRKLVRMAIKHNWPITENIRKGIVYHMMEAVRDKQAEWRDRTSAADVLVSADKVSLESIKIALKAIESEKPQSPSQHIHFHNTPPATATTKQIDQLLEEIESGE